MGTQLRSDNEVGLREHAKHKTKARADDSPTTVEKCLVDFKASFSWSI